jgi:hypothetical protein
LGDDFLQAVLKNTQIAHSFGPHFLALLKLCKKFDEKWVWGTRKRMDTFFLATEMPSGVRQTLKPIFPPFLRIFWDFIYM